MRACQYETLDRRWLGFQDMRRILTASKAMALYEWMVMSSEFRPGWDADHKLVWIVWSLRSWIVWSLNRQSWFVCIFQLNRAAEGGMYREVIIMGWLCVSIVQRVRRFNVCWLIAVTHCDQMVTESSACLRRLFLSLSEMNLGLGQAPNDILIRLVSAKLTTSRQCCLNKIKTGSDQMNSWSRTSYPTTAILSII